MSVSCARILSRLQPFVEGEIASHDAFEVSAHLEGCQACRRRVRGYRAIFASLDQMPQVMPPPEFRNAIMERVIAADLAQRRARRPHLRLVQSVLAFLATTLAAGGGLVTARAWQSVTGGRHLPDMAILAEQVRGLGRLTLGLLLDVVTRADLPSLPSVHSPFRWGALAAAILLLGGLVGVVGVGLLATARTLWHPSSRR